MRIALIHALRHSPPPVEAAFARLWPEATLMNLLDDSLSADLAREGALTRTPRRTWLLSSESRDDGRPAGAASRPATPTA